MRDYVQDHGKDKPSKNPPKPDPDKPAFKLMPGAKRRVEQDLCPTCGNKVGQFRDALSRKEYSISGMCQKCQDRVF